MPRRPTARELTAAAARARPPARGQALRDEPSPVGSGLARPNEALAMLARRGFQTASSAADLPFPDGFPEPHADRLAELLGHYGFRLFLRGAIQRAAGFAPAETTRYLSAAQSRRLAEALAELGLAARLPRGRYRLVHPARSFGGVLEWYVARELRARLGFDVATDLKFRARGVGGDLDVVAAAEGKLVYLELKSSPPAHLSASELAAFVGRWRALRPDVALFVVDTALRLADKVVPGLGIELARAGVACRPCRVERELWALTPHLYAVNARPDLVRNVARALAEGLRALAPGRGAAVLTARQANPHQPQGHQAKRAQPQG